MKLKSMLFAAAFFAAAALLNDQSVRAEDRVNGYSYVNEVADQAQGEKTKTTSYDRQGVKVGVKTEYDNGQVKNETYRADGTLKSVHVNDFKGWSKDTEYGDNGKTTVKELVRRNNRMYTLTEFKPGGALKITQYGFDADPKIDFIDEIDDKGNGTRTHFTYEQRLSGAVDKFKREEQLGGTVKWTFFRDNSTAIGSVDYVYNDGRKKTVYYADDGKTIVGSSTKQSVDRYSDTIAREFFDRKTGVLTSDRDKVPGKSYSIRAYYPDGKTVSFKQTWVPAQPRTKSTTTSPRRWQLQSIEEFDQKGEIVRKLIFDKIGDNIVEVDDFKDGAVVTKTFLKGDGAKRVDGSVERIEHYTKGTLTKTETAPAGTPLAQPLDEKRLRDPHFGEHEPDLMRIYR